MNPSGVLNLNFGLQRQLCVAIEPDRLLGNFVAPSAATDPMEAIRAALKQPLEFPRLFQAVLDDDKVALVLDNNTPDASLLIAAVWEELTRSRIAPENITIVQPADPSGQRQYDPRADLPDEIQDRIGWKIHDPGLEDECSYLASTASGERLYLDRTVHDADVVVTIGETAFDRTLGYRGTSSPLFPGLSNEEAFEKARGQGHRELAPEDNRPLRELNDEAAWLLGTQFTIQVIASSGGRFSHVIAGEREAVFRDAKKQLNDDWMIQIDERPDAVVASIDLDAGGHGWKQIARALSTARNLVDRDGKIILLTELREEPGEGIALLKQAAEPRDAYDLLRQSQPADQNEATELIDALEHASVYLLSQLPSETIEDLHITPLESQVEAERLIASVESCAVIESAQHTWGRILEG